MHQLHFHEIEVSKIGADLKRLMSELKGERKLLRNGVLRVAGSDHNLSLLSPYLNPKPAPAALQAVLPFERPIMPWKDYQARAFEAMKDKSVFGLILEMGLGKTKLALDKAWRDFSLRRITGVLIVAPLGVHSQWIEEQLPKHIPASLIKATGIWNGKKVVNVLGDQRLDGLEFLSINIDGIKTINGNKACVDFINRHNGKVTMIVDESHKIKNYRAARTKMCVDLGLRCAQRMFLTGTPIAKDLTDEWSQFNFLDLRIIGTKYVTAFRSKFCIMGGWENRQVVGHQNVEAYNKLVAPFCFRATKEELDLPPKSYKEYSFELTDHQRRALKEIKEEAALMIDGKLVDLENIVMKAQQITNGFILHGEEQLVEFDNPRMAALDNCIEQRSGKIVIWARFRKDIQNIKAHLGDEAVTYYGEDNKKEREAAIERFMNGNARFFVSTPQAGGTGLNLQGECSTAIYYSNCHKPIERWQSEDRIHRIGTVYPVLYIDLVAKGGADKSILRILQKRKSTADEILTGRESIQNMQNVLKDLLA